MKSEERISGFTEAIWEWYGTHKRELPWRDMKIENDTERAYRVLISEVMLQQTQVSRVKIVFKDFLGKFPSLQDLADASNSDVIMAWRGMGYNSRALRLRDAAKSVIDIFSGTFPSDMDELLAIKGLGPYTAAAIRNFAFNIPTPCIDTNIRRILHRVFIGPENGDGTWAVGDKQLLKIAEQVLAIACQPELDEGRHDARNWHAALMDYGSLVQTKNNPKWDICILTDRGIMKTTQKSFELRVASRKKNSILDSRSSKKMEPGRFVGSKYIPNRIFRGKIVEALRDAEKPMSSEEIGKQICIDWEAQHREWLLSLLVKLETDQLIKKRGAEYLLA
jgi:A/G-specific adenine glycosylase